MSETSISFTSFANIINGERHSEGALANGTDPSHGIPLWDVPVASKDDLNDAVAAARSAFPGWMQTPWQERQNLLQKLRLKLKQYQADMAEILMKEADKPRQFAALEVDHALNFLDFHAKVELLTEVVIQDDHKLSITELYSPIGVVAAICAWNFPLVLAVGKMVAALVSGNCVIAKPSPFTPYSILKLAEMAIGIFPPGVFQAINGDETTGPFLVEHPLVDKISFTGSTATGKRIMESASKTLKNITLELGGNSATIVCPDVDIAKVAPQIALGAFFNSGQVCIASKRIYVHEIGPAPDPESFLGPVQNLAQYRVVQNIFEDCKLNEYSFATGSEATISGKGYLIRPAIIDNPPDTSMIVTEEPFGPIVPIQSWKTKDELILRVNNTLSGLGGSVWSSDPDRAQCIARRIEAGTIRINSFEKPLPRGYFSGWKESGVGGEWGKHGLYAYCKVQVIHRYKSDVGMVSQGNM